jgi:hypothetical protein
MQLSLTFVPGVVASRFNMYVLLDGWKPESKYHQELMALHLRGNGCAKTPTIAEDLEFFKKVFVAHAANVFVLI